MRSLWSRGPLLFVNPSEITDTDVTDTAVDRVATAPRLAAAVDVDGIPFNRDRA